MTNNRAPQPTHTLVTTPAQRHAAAPQPIGHCTKIPARDVNVMIQTLLCRWLSEHAAGVYGGKAHHIHCVAWDRWVLQPTSNMQNIYTTSTHTAHSFSQHMLPVRLLAGDTVSLSTKSNLTTLCQYKNKDCLVIKHTSVATIHDLHWCLFREPPVTHAVKPKHDEHTVPVCKAAYDGVKQHYCCQVQLIAAATCRTCCTNSSPTAC